MNSKCAGFSFSNGGGFYKGNAMGGFVNDPESVAPRAVPGNVPAARCARSTAGALRVPQQCYSRSTTSPAAVLQ